MSVIICPGIHDPNLTQEFLKELGWQGENFLIFPTENYPAYSAIHILTFLRDTLLSGGNTFRGCDRNLSELPVIFISFSAGAVGAIGACLGWQMLGGKVKAFIALDAWGVPLGGNFPIHRLSHDYFTHWSSALLGSGEDSFYADPPVEHLELWRSPQSVQGWWVNSTTGSKSPPRTPMTAAGFLKHLLQHYQVQD
jgi:hypothetical protein